MAGAARSRAGAAAAWAWAGEATLGQTRGGRPGKKQIEFSIYFLFPTDLNHKFEQPKTVFRIWGKNKSCPKNVLYNFAKRNKAKIQLDFEL